MNKDKIIDAIISEVYFADDDIEKLKANMYYWEWTIEQDAKVEKELKEINYFAFGMSLALPYEVKEYINSVKDKIINLSKDFNFETQYPDLASQIILEAKGLNDSIISGIPEFISKEIFLANGRGAYLAAKSYVLDSVHKFWELAPANVNKELMKSWEESFKRSYGFQTDKKFKY